MWIVILISFIWCGIWQLFQIPYFYFKTIFKQHHIKFRVGHPSHEGEKFNGSFGIRTRPTGFATSYDYFEYAKPKVLEAQNNKHTLYYAYGALKFFLNQDLTITSGYDDEKPVPSTRENTHNTLIYALHLMYFARWGCDKINFECNRLRDNILKISDKDGRGDEGFFNGSETIGFSDAINIGLEGECPSWIGHVSKGIISCAILAVLESKCIVKKEKRKLKWIYRLLKSRHLIASMYPFISNEHTKEDYEALIASYEVLLDYDNNLFYRIGYRKIIEVMKESKCSLEEENTLKLNEALKPQLFH